MDAVENGCEEERRFFFAHVQKAAGTSLFHRLQRQFDSEAIYPCDADLAVSATEDEPVPRLPRLSATLLVSHLRACYASRRSNIRIVTGHFPIRTTELLGDEFVTLTLLRDPVERTLSALRHHQARTPADSARPLDVLYDDPIRFNGLIHNHMVKMFSLSPEEISRGDGVMAHVSFSRDRLDEAKARLAAVDVLGLHDQLDDFCDDLTTRFGWRLGESVHANRTEPAEVGAHFRDRIAEDNAMDVELFEYARELHRRAPRDPRE